MSNRVIHIEDGEAQAPQLREAKQPLRLLLSPAAGDAQILIPFPEAYRRRLIGSGIRQLV
jgi:hypothetical protein